MPDSYLGLAALIVIATSTVFWIRALKRVEIPENRGGFLASWLVAGGLGLTSLIGEPGLLGGIPAGIAVFASAFFLLTFAIGNQKVGENAIRVGARHGAPPGYLT